MSLADAGLHPLLPDDFATWDALITDVENAGAKDVMVAGGCIRDLLLGADVTDVDIFHRERVLLSMLNKNGWDVRERELDPNYDVKVDRIVEGEAPQSIPVNVLECQDVQARFDNFAANISKVFYVKGRLLLHPEFITAVKTKVILFDEGTSMNYRDKITNKFKPLGFIFPQADMEF